MTKFITFGLQIHAKTHDTCSYNCGIPDCILSLQQAKQEFSPRGRRWITLKARVDQAVACSASYVMFLVFRHIWFMFQGNLNLESHWWKLEIENNSNSLAATTTIKIHNGCLEAGREKNDVKNDEKKSKLKGTNPWFYQPNSLVYWA